MSDFNNFTPEQKVREMAKLSLLSNKISQIQEKNLKTYPFVFFDNVKTARIEYDLTNRTDVETEENDQDIRYQVKASDGAHFKVRYDLEISDAEVPDLEKRVAAIRNAVRTLFWNNIKVEVLINGVEV